MGAAAPSFESGTIAEIIEARATKSAAISTPNGIALSNSIIEFSKFIDPPIRQIAGRQTLHMDMYTGADIMQFEPEPQALCLVSTVRQLRCDKISSHSKQVFRLRVASRLGVSLR